LITAVREAIARAYGWPDSQPRSLEIRPPRLDASAYVGIYQLGNGEVLHVERSATGLVLVSPGQDQPIELYPAGGDEWFARAVRARVAFELGEDGRPARLVLHQDAEYVQEVEAQRLVGSDHTGQR
jgi:Domain of unknown function (DUF3471)